MAFNEDGPEASRFSGKGHSMRRCRFCDVGFAETPPLIPDLSAAACNPQPFVIPPRLPPFPLFSKATRSGSNNSVVVTQIRNFSWNRARLREAVRVDPCVHPSSNSSWEPRSRSGWPLFCCHNSRLFPLKCWETGLEICEKRKYCRVSEGRTMCV